MRKKLANIVYMSVFVVVPLLCWGFGYYTGREDGEYYTRQQCEHQQSLKETEWKKTLIQAEQVSQKLENAQLELQSAMYAHKAAIEQLKKAK